MWYWWKNRQIYQQNRIESSEKDPQIQLNDLWKRQFNGERIVFQQMVLSIEQLHSNVQKKTQKTSVQFCACPPSIQTPTSTIFSGEYASVLLEAANIPTLSPFQPLHVQPFPSQVKTHRALRTTFTIGFRSFLSPHSTSISFLPFVYINCFLQNGIYFLLPGFSPTLCTG